MKFLLVCSQPLGQDNLDEFRLPELESIAKLLNFDIRYVDETPDISRPYLVVELAGEREARLLGSRAVSVKHIWEYWEDGKDYDDLHERIKNKPECWQALAATTASWKFNVGAFARTMTQKNQLDIINGFGYMAFKGDINLAKPDIEIGVFEEYKTKGKTVRGRILNEMRRVWMGRKLCDTRRNMVDVFNLKKRAYIGNTSMDSEVSLLMAQQGLAAPGKLVYDPFAGTGSMLLTCAAFGAMVFGGDIDGRQIRGKTTTIPDSASQYGIQDRILDCAVFDVTQHPFRTGEIFDAIVTDPPYGVRAGAKKLGRKEDYVYKPVPGHKEEVYTHELPDYVPATQPWEMEEVIHSLITYSLFLLKPSGRLVFFLPTETASYQDNDIPIIPGMRMVSNSSQNFGKWARRLITMEKVGGGEEILAELDRGIFRKEGRMDGRTLVGDKKEGTRPGHAGFRDRYFAHFVPSVEDTTVA